MNAIVEVTTAETVVEVSEVVVVTTKHNFPLEVMAPVVTSTFRAVVSLGSHSISAVAPDSNFQIGGLAVA